MSGKIVLRQSPTTRQQPLLKGQGSQVAEVVGGTAAECAAICCCCPCTIANLLVLVVYKVPAGLCRRALGKNRKGMLPPRRHRCSCGCDGTENQIHAKYLVDASEILKSQELDEEVQQLEKEMWDRFYSTGFWRSPSQRESSDTITNPQSRIPVYSTLEISRVTYL